MITSSLHIFFNFITFFSSLLVFFFRFPSSVSHIYLFFFSFFIFHFSRLRDYLDPRKIFEDRKLNQILKDLTEALEYTPTTSFSFSTTSPPSLSSSSLLLWSPSVGQIGQQPVGTIQTLHLELINAPGKL